jgi:hypothetical protein
LYDTFSGLQIFLLVTVYQPWKWHKNFREFGVYLKEVMIEFKVAISSINI